MRDEERSGLQAIAVFLAISLSLIASYAKAADFPAPQEGDWIAKEFRFHTGEVMPALRLHYRTIGSPAGEPVLLLHGTAGESRNFLAPSFADQLFGPGQPLDATRYYVIMPDAIGAGGSAKPSDGLRTKFPAYNYDDMVAAQYDLVTQGLRIPHLRLVFGNSMGGMHAWLWGEQHPAFMDILVPAASQPVEMSGRNWMMRRMIIDAIRNDPTWDRGNYTKQPAALQVANVFFGIATSGGSRAYYRQAPTREKADRFVDARLKTPLAADANDFLYQWEASRDYDPNPGLEKIEASVLAINAEDDERNPPELGIMEREMKRIRKARLYIVPGSEDTAGHGTTMIATLWKQQLADVLQATPASTTATKVVGK